MFLMFLTPNKEITQQRVLYCVIREINDTKKWIKNVIECCPHEEGSSKVILHITVFLSESGHFNPQIMIHLYKITLYDGLKVHNLHVCILKALKYTSIFVLTINLHIIRQTNHQKILLF